MKNFFTVCIALVCSGLFAQAQDVKFAQYVIDTLCSPYYGGRGYVDHGDIRASKFIANQFSLAQLDPVVGDDFYHNFRLNVNTFPGVVKITRNKGELSTGHDFIVAPNCKSIKETDQTVVFVHEQRLLDKKMFKHLLKTNWSNKVLVLDTLSKDKKVVKRLAKLMKKYPREITLEVHKKLTWGVGRDQSSKRILLKPGVLSDGDKIDIEVEAVFKKSYKARNVVGMIKGTEHPDSFIIVTGHYDHLGKMGQDCYIPGANDNASGIAMILDLMHYYRQHPPAFSIVFIGFAGEEAGLVGSYHFVKEMKNHLDPNAIRFVVNMDLMGSGQEGIMAVNGANLTKEYALLESINEEHKFLPQTKKRSQSANSDHYFFSEVGIPAFFFYLMGPYNHYHDVDDSAENLRLEKKAYDGSFNLIRYYIDALMRG